MIQWLAQLAGHQGIFANALEQYRHKRSTESAPPLQLTTCHPEYAHAWSTLAECEAWIKAQRGGWEPVEWHYSENIIVSSAGSYACSAPARLPYSVLPKQRHRRRRF